MRFRSFFALPVVVSLATAIVLATSTSSRAEAEAKRVLMLHSFGLRFKPWTDFAQIIRSEITRNAQRSVDFHDHSLLNARLNDDTSDGPFVDYLYALYAAKPPHLILAIGAPAANFVQRHRQRIFPGTPMLFTAVEARRVQYDKLTEDDTVVAAAHDFPASFENILRVLPRTKTIAIVNGASPNETFWLGELRRETAPLTGRVELKFYNELSFEDILKDAANLPPHSAIFWHLMSVDAAGVAHEANAALSKLSATANAPVFSYLDSFFGDTTVGGPMHSVEEGSVVAAAVAVRILNGEKAGDIKTPPTRYATPKFDWRQMQRWGISESSLPPGSEIHFRTLTAWQQYRWLILTLTAALLLQAAMITGLLYEHRHRRRSEAAAHKLGGRLITAHEEERARLARELHDDVTQRLAALAIDAGHEERKSPAIPGGSPMRAMREGLVRLSEDVHALSYRLHPSTLEDLGLTAALKSECERFSQTCSTRLETSVQDLPETLPREVALCLFRIAQEGLRNIARHAGASQAKVRLQRLDGGLQLTVKDDGTGFDPAQHRTRTSLGHAGMQQRVSLLGGRITIRSRPGHGVTIEAWVPLEEKPSRAVAHPAG